MNKFILALLLFSLISCGKPGESLTGPVPDKTDWPFGNAQKLLFKRTDSGAYAQGDKYSLQMLEITKANGNLELKSRFGDGSYTQSDYWLKSIEGTNQVGYAERVTFESDMKTQTLPKNQFVAYGMMYVKQTENAPLSIVIYEGSCPYEVIDPKAEELQYRPLHACTAKNADNMWRLISLHKDMQNRPKMFELLSQE